MRLAFAGIAQVSTDTEDVESSSATTVYEPEVSGTAINAFSELIDSEYRARVVARVSVTPTSVFRLACVTVTGAVMYGNEFFTHALMSRRWLSADARSAAFSGYVAFNAEM
jgi:hypothetical protein